MKAATWMLTRLGLKGNISIHAAREGGDIIGMWLGMGVKISIHAAREGGDKARTQAQVNAKHFNPRRP